MQQQTVIDTRRVHRLGTGRFGAGPVIYWMSREQRADDNWALLFAQEQALSMQRPLITIFCLCPDYPGANLRHFSFLLRGLEQVQTTLERHRIPLVLLEGDPGLTLPSYLTTNDAALLVTDFDPLRVKQQWKTRIIRKTRIPVFEVDAHNIVPCRVASDKREYAAYTIRRKINGLLPAFLTGFPDLKRHPFPAQAPAVKIDAGHLLARIKDTSVAEISWLQPGEQAAGSTLGQFIRHRLPDYPVGRNNPCIDGQSNLSPYLHFGQIAPQRVALEVKESGAPRESIEAYLEELIVRRELADNFCHHTANYNRTDGFPDWATKTLDAHRGDPRPYRADQSTLENAATAEPLWNACQQDLARRGKLHGYLRMYWAKKILEWSGDPEEALANAIYLNDKYALDGRDPNGYAGIAWSIGGVHDRAWPERPIFGKIRYMNENGCRRKFKVDDYIDSVNRGGLL